MLKSAPAKMIALTHVPSKHDQASSRMRRTGISGKPHLRTSCDIPLLYVIGEDEVAPDGSEYEIFQAECIAQCQVKGPQFKPNARQVH